MLDLMPGFETLLCNSFQRQAQGFLSIRSWKRWSFQIKPQYQSEAQTHLGLFQCERALDTLHALQRELNI